MTICDGCHESGGRFVMIGEKWYHKGKCEGFSSSNAFKTSTFPFTTTHFGGSNVEVQSMRHLRSLERQHGVVSVAYNQNSNNWDR